MHPRSRNIEESIRELTAPWSPIELARFDDYVVNLALFHGEYHWHSHPNGDDAFYVYKGEIVIQMRERPDLTVREGEFAVVPRGISHCPKSEGPSYVIMFEPIGLESIPA